MSQHQSRKTVDSLIPLCENVDKFPVSTCVLSERIVGKIQGWLIFSNILLLVIII